MSDQVNRADIDKEPCSRVRTLCACGQSIWEMSLVNEAMNNPYYDGIGHLHLVVGKRLQEHGINPAPILVIEPESSTNAHGAPWSTPWHPQERRTKVFSVGARSIGPVQAIHMIGVPAVVVPEVRIDS